MSDTHCSHVCECDCHYRVEKRYGDAAGGLVELGPTTMHIVACCDGLCPDGCHRFIKSEMTKSHLMDARCHNMSEVDADRLMNAESNWARATRRRPSFLETFAE